MDKTKNYKYPSNEGFTYVKTKLEEKGVTLHDIAKISYDLQIKHAPGVSVDEYEEKLIKVMHKHEVLNNILVGLQLDELASKDMLDEPLLSLIKQDVGVFGVDELLAQGITQLYGSIGITNFGYVDKVKHGIIAKLDTTDSQVNTFIDDIVGALATAVAGKVAHEQAGEE